MEEEGRPEGNKRVGSRIVSREVVVEISKMVSIAVVV